MKLQTKAEFAEQPESGRRLRQDGSPIGREVERPRPGGISLPATRIEMEVCDVGHF